ncbi:hypothetical protein HK105_209232 [Polyrhizophydium stewartii]|uniref:Uncharacterized protein n=1 Tax=Polyrhizophydium stewartii TaxID=2732419 RepID=A0ABR4MVQ9_9FUNG
MASETQLRAQAIVLKRALLDQQQANRKLQERIDELQALRVQHESVLRWIEALAGGMWAALSRESAALPPPQELERQLGDLLVALLQYHISFVACLAPSSGAAHERDASTEHFATLAVGMRTNLVRRLLRTHAIMLRSEPKSASGSCSPLLELLEDADVLLAGLEGTLNLQAHDSAVGHQNLIKARLADLVGSLQLKLREMSGESWSGLISNGRRQLLSEMSAEAVCPAQLRDMF